jgi:hypothetical protein
MTPVNLTIEQGTTYRRSLKFYSNSDLSTRFDLTGFVLKAQARDSWGSPLRIEIGLDVTDAENGEVDLVVEPEQTVSLNPAVYYWDLLLVSLSGVVTKYAKGSIQILPTQTKINA